MIKRQYLLTLLLAVGSPSAVGNAMTIVGKGVVDMPPARDVNSKII
jgi:hypothetical protein